MNCSASCPTQDHATWGECVRAKGLSIGYARSAAGFDATREKKWDAEIARYRSAVAQGMDPDGTTTAKVRQAEQWSEKNGMAYSPEAVKAKKTEALLSKVMN